MDILLGTVRIIVIALAIWIAVQYVRLQYYKWDSSWMYQDSPYQKDPFPWWWEND